MELTADVIAIAFNQENERKTWQARPNNRDSAETVHFSAQTGMIALIYNVRNKTWHVRFNKFQTSWGDYIRSISRALYIVLTTLKQAGLPFDAPEAPEGIEIVCQASPDADTLVRYVPPAEPVNPFAIGDTDGAMMPSFDFSMGDFVDSPVMPPPPGYEEPPVGP